MDPAKGLWDQPGWKRYIPPGSVGADGQSRVHNGSGQSACRQRLSRPAQAWQRRRKAAGVGPASGAAMPLGAGSYNLAGFPIHPDAAQAPMAGAFFASSPITEAGRLSSAGTWGDPIPFQRRDCQPERQAASGRGVPGVLCRRRSQRLLGPVEASRLRGDRLVFGRGYGATQQSVGVENLSTTAATVNLALPAGSTMPLYYVNRSTQPRRAMISAGARPRCRWPPRARRS